MTLISRARCALAMLLCSLAGSACTGAEPESCGGRMFVRSEADLATASACERVDELWIASSSLTTLTGLEGLREVRHLVIASNPALVDASGLDGLERVGGAMLWGNPMLDTVATLAPNARIEDFAILDGGVRGAEALAGRVSGSLSLPDLVVPDFDDD